MPPTVIGSGESPPMLPMPASSDRLPAAIIPAPPAATLMLPGAVISTTPELEVDLIVPMFKSLAVLCR